MKVGKILGAALLASAGAAAMAAPASAEEFTFSGNVALTSDYVFRGISQSEEGPAVQGGFDVGYGMFYAGTWASNVDFEEAAVGTLGLNAPLEIDLYAGVKPTLGPLALDIGVVGYFYPGASENTPGVGELDYVEGYLKASHTFAEKLTVGGAVFYSPEFTAETGTAYYLEANAAYTVSDKLGISGAVGYQSIDDVSGVFASTAPGFPAEASDEYTTWNIGATYSLAGFSFDLRYVDTTIDTGDLILADLYTTDAKTEGRAVFTIKRAL